MSRVLIVEDDETLRRSVRRSLEGAGHEVLEAGAVPEARSLLYEVGIELVLCDITLPGDSGLELVRWLSYALPEVAVVMLTGMDDPAVAREALEMGAYGYLVKPTRPNEVLINVVSGLKRRELELARRQHVRELEAKLLVRGTALRDMVKQLEQAKASVAGAEQEAVDRLVTALTLRSEETGAHIRRVGRYAAVLAERCGIEAWSGDEMRMAAMLHDVGKIGIPDAILLKPGHLDAEEFEVIKRHCALGYALLAEGQARVLELGACIALAHHERWDGAGYPSGLHGQRIPVEGRIAAVADVFDALTSHRVYRPAMSFDQATEILLTERGRQFDPDLVELFLDSLEAIAMIRSDHPDHAAA